MNKITKTKDGISVPDKVIIPYIEGDGIGVEITPVMTQVVDAAVEKAYGGKKAITWKEVLVGGKAFDQTGEWLPKETLDIIKEYLVAIKGPLMTPVGGGMRSLNVALRQELDLYVCLRPVRWFKGIISPLKEPDKVNMHIFRENTEDIYSGIEWEQGTPEAKKFYKFLKEEMGVTKVRFPETSAFGVKPVSIEGTERLVRAAVEYTIVNKLPYLTIVHKGNIMKFTEGGFKNWAYKLVRKEFSNKCFTMEEYEEIKNLQGKPAAEEALNNAKDRGMIIVKDVIADAFLQSTLLKPYDHSVIATLNLNGDYISDQLAAMVGGIGIAPGANINYHSGHAIFEATHGTAPNMAGENRVNPSSIILSAVMMLDHMGWNEAGDLIIHAMETLFQSGMATADLARFMPNGKKLSTTEFRDAIINNLK